MEFDILKKKTTLRRINIDLTTFCGTIAEIQQKLKVIQKESGLSRDDLVIKIHEGDYEERDSYYFKIKVEESNKDYQKRLQKNLKTLESKDHKLRSKVLKNSADAAGLASEIAAIKSKLEEAK